MKGNRFKSLKIILSTVVVSIVAVLIVLLIAISYNTAYSSVEYAYLNQLQNFNKDINSQLENFYAQQLANATFFSTNPVVREAVSSNNFDRATAMIKSFSDEHKLYENIFISTAEKNPSLIAAVAGVGTRWGGTGYDENITENLNGKVHISDPRKSPVTGLPVCLISAPIMNGGQIAGIMAFAVNIGEFSSRIVKDLKIGKTGYASIADMTGIAFAHPDKDMILKLDFREHEWGRKVLNSESGTIIRYTFEGSDKILTFVKNRKFPFISVATMFISDINADARSMAGIMVLFGLIGLAVCSTGIYIMIARRLKPLDECKEVMGEMAKGNIAMRYKGRVSGDEIGDIAGAMNNSLDQFEKVISEILVASQNLAQAVEQIASGNQNLSQRTSEQASSLEEMASTIEEATASINQNAENAMQANKEAIESAKLANEGNKIVVDAVQSINEISASSKKIGDIISVIDEIAFQTNLLALNAAVEAARAGEHGRGFAVVAGEVRNLAQRSGSSAKDVSLLIGDSIEKVAHGTDMVNKSGEALKEIIESITRVGERISEIAAASEEQKQGIGQINTAISEMDAMTQQNASLVEETASASEEMANQAQELLGMMDRFTIKETTKTDFYKTKHKELHLKAANGGNGKGDSHKGLPGNGGASNSKVHHSATDAKKSTSLKKIMAEEGFQEF